MVEYLIKHDLEHPVVSNVRKLPDGWNDLRSDDNRDLAIDYIRSNMFRATEMKPLPHMVSGPNNDLFDYIEALLQRAIDDESAVV